MPARHESWVFIRIYNSKTAANARRFLRALDRACPLRIRTSLTDTGKAFADCLFGLRKRGQSGRHACDRLCAERDIEHRLAPPRPPQTNGMVARVTGRIEDVLQGHHFRSGAELEANLYRCLALQPAVPAVSLGQQVPLASDEGLAQTQT